MQLPEQDYGSVFVPLLSYVQQAQRDFGSSAASIIIIHNDHIAFEWYGGFHHGKSGAKPITASSMFNVYSTRKTYVCLAMAIAIIEGKISVDTPVYKIVTDLSRDVLGEVTIRNLATGTGPKYFGEGRIEREEIQAKVVERLTGKTIARLISDRVIAPLKLSDTEWITAPRVNLVCDYTSSGGYASIRIESDKGHERNLYVSTRDLAYWGYMHLMKGKWDSVRSIPQEVFELTESLLAQHPDNRILGWYHQTDWYYATGAAGCHCVVLPNYKAVGVRMFNKYTNRYKEDQIAFNSILLDCLKSL